MYKNAPLVEVIAEVHWDLRTVDTSTGIQTDPYYFPLQDKFIEASSEQGLSYQEFVVPNFVPIEHSASHPRLRLRENAEKWPVVQLGPGILTANIVPPYGGWREFETFLLTQIECLLNAYRDIGQSISVNRLHLRYIDGFDHHFNFDHFPTFAKEMLSFSCPLPRKFREEHVRNENEYVYVLDVSFACKAPSKSRARLKISPGTLKDEQALILEISCETINKNRIQNSTQIKDWFSQAHKAIKRQFETLTTSNLKIIMGETLKKEASVPKK